MTKVKSQAMKDGYIEVTYENGTVRKLMYLEDPVDGGYLEICPNAPETFHTYTPKDYYVYD